MSRDDREVVVVEREGGGALKWLVVGAALGAGLALLFTPKTGKELRRELGRGIKGIRDLADETLEELSHDPTAEEQELRSMADEGGASAGDEAGDEAPPRRPGARPSMVAAREELERRLEAARARRRQVVPDDDEEPVA
jgi:gas vesicle protein